MKTIEATTLDADEKSTHYQGVSLSEAIALYRTFPWHNALIKAQETECFPIVSFAISPVHSHGEYINIFKTDSSITHLMIEAFIKQPLLGFIPRWKSTFLDIELSHQSAVEEFIRQFFELPQPALYDWIIHYKNTNSENIN